MEYMKLKTHGSNFDARVKNIDSYHYHIHIVTSSEDISVTQPRFLFFITETFRGKPTSGGSMYGVVIEGSDYVTKCPVMDYFNGSYAVCCAMQMECSHVSVKLMFVNFAAFWDEVPRPQERLIWKHSICTNKTVGGVKPVRACAANDLSNSRYNGYFKILKGKEFAENPLRWSVGDCMVPRAKGRWKECVNKQNSVTIIGDSHMRYTSNLSGSFPEITTTTYIREMTLTLTSIFSDTVILSMKISVTTG